MRRKTRRRAKPSALAGALRLGLVFAALIAVNVYIFYFRRGTSLKDLARLSADKALAETVIAAPPKSKAAKAAAPERPALAPGATEDDPSLDDGRLVEATLSATDTLAAILKRESV